MTKAKGARALSVHTKFLPKADTLNIDIPCCLSCCCVYLGYMALQGSDRERRAATSDCVNAACCCTLERRASSCAYAYPSSLSWSGIFLLPSWKPKIHCRIHNSPSLAPLLNPSQSKLFFTSNSPTQIIFSENL